MPGARPHAVVVLLVDEPAVVQHDQGVGVRPLDEFRHGQAPPRAILEAQFPRSQARPIGDQVVDGPLPREIGAVGINSPMRWYALTLYGGRIQFSSVTGSAAPKWSYPDIGDMGLILLWAGELLHAHSPLGKLIT
ncbi:MAG TPA: hypothetical protein VM347_22215 [Nonomuraea sp.]|nr:hypothetical protein [Nonomuraea sp.]